MQAGFAMTAPADKGKKARTEADGGEEIDTVLVRSIEQLQEIQDELEKVSRESLFPLPLGILGPVVMRYCELCPVGPVRFGSGGLRWS